MLTIAAYQPKAPGLSAYLIGLFNQAKLHSEYQFAIIV